MYPAGTSCFAWYCTRGCWPPHSAGCAPWQNEFSANRNKRPSDATSEGRFWVVGLSFLGGGFPVGAGYAPPAVLWLQQYTGSSVGAAYMPPVAAARILRYIGKIARASNARPYNRTGKLRQPHDSPAGWGHPALRGNKKHYAVGAGYAPPAVLWLQQYTGSSVGTATMPLVAITRALQYNGQTARNGQDRSLQTCRRFAIFPVIAYLPAVCRQGS